jgi:hypothetical protein
MIPKEIFPKLYGSRISLGVEKSLVEQFRIGDEDRPDIRRAFTDTVLNAALGKQAKLKLLDPFAREITDEKASMTLEIAESVGDTFYAKWNKKSKGPYPHL